MAKPSSETSLAGPNIEEGVLEAVTVECYSGYTYAERPVAFVWRGRRYVIGCVLKRWRSPNGHNFRVRIPDGDQFELICYEAKDEWFLKISSSSLHRKEKHNDA